jgi:hypothetical protein
MMQRHDYRRGLFSGGCLAKAERYCKRPSPACCHRAFMEAEQGAWAGVVSCYPVPISLVPVIIPDQESVIGCARKVSTTNDEITFARYCVGISEGNSRHIDSGVGQKRV